MGRKIWAWVSASGAQLVQKTDAIRVRQPYSG